MATSNILCLDIATKTGFVVGDEEGNIIHSGTFDSKTLKERSIGERFLVFHKFLLSAIKQYDVREVYYEQVMTHNSSRAAQIYWGFAAQMETICHQYHMEPKGFAVTSIKKFFTGSGKADKAAMIAEARNRGHDPIDDNEADAIAIYYCALEVMKRR